jgi:hypothetical protein
MANSTRGQLTQKIREHIVALGSDELATRQVVEAIIQGNPGLVALEQSRLIRMSLSNMVARIVGSPRLVQQSTFPGFDEINQLPAMLPIRASSKSGPARWVAWQHLTAAELDEVIKELKKPARSRTKLIGLTKLQSLVKKRMKETIGFDTTSPISDILGLTNTSKEVGQTD